MTKNRTSETSKKIRIFLENIEISCIDNLVPNIVSIAFPTDRTL